MRKLVCTARPGAKVRRGRGLTVRKRPLNTFGTFPPFTALAELFSLLFLFVSFQDSLALEEPVKVLKVGLYISACRVACGVVDWYKANFRL